MGLGGKVKVEKVSLRGLTLGGYDTRRAWAVVYGQGFDLAGLNKVLAEQKRRPIQGLLGNLDLLNGSAVIDFGTNTLYLRPVKETVGPELEGKWVGVRYEFDGQRGGTPPATGRSSSRAAGSGSPPGAGRRSGGSTCGTRATAIGSGCSTRGRMSWPTGSGTPVSGCSSWPAAPSPW